MDTGHSTCDKIRSTISRAKMGLKSKNQPGHFVTVVLHLKQNSGFRFLNFT